jgi:hypothetical protein
LLKDKTISFNKIRDNLTSKNYKTPHQLIKILSSPKINPLNDPLKPNNKNPSLTKDNSKNSNFNKVKTKIHFGMITETGPDKKTSTTIMQLIISNIKMSGKRKFKNFKSNYTITTTLIFIKGQHPLPLKFQLKKTVRDKM